MILHLPAEQERCRCGPSWRPSAMAASKSLLMPMLRWRRPVPPILCHFISSKISRRAGEGVAELRFVGVERGHGHQADELEVGHRVDLLGEVDRRADGDAVLLRLFAGVDLQQHGHLACRSWRPVCRSPRRGAGCRCCGSADTSGRSGLTLLRWRWPIMCQRSFGGDGRRRRAAARRWRNSLSWAARWVSTCTRLSPRSPTPSWRISRICSGAAVLVTAMSVTSVGSRLALAAGGGDAVLHLVQLFGQRRSFGHAGSFRSGP